MKKAKLFFLMITTSLLMVSCGSDDSGSDTGPGPGNGGGNPSGDLIVGNWKYIGDIDEDGYEASDHEPCDDEFLKFNSNGTASNTINYCGDDPEIINSTWQKAPEANKYIFGDGQGNFAEAKVVFSQNNNRIAIYDYEDQFYAIVYQRQ